MLLHCKGSSSSSAAGGNGGGLMHFIYTTRWAAAFNDVLAGWLAGVPKEWKELQKQGKKRV